MESWSLGMEKILQVRASKNAEGGVLAPIESIESSIGTKNEQVEITQTIHHHPYPTFLGLK